MSTVIIIFKKAVYEKLSQVMSVTLSTKGKSSAPHHHNRPCTNSPQARNKSTCFPSAQICYDLNGRLPERKKLEDTQAGSLRA